jgi:hypothetical protein
MSIDPNYILEVKDIDEILNKPNVEMHIIKNAASLSQIICNDPQYSIMFKFNGVLEDHKIFGSVQYCFDFMPEYIYEYINMGSANIVKIPPDEMRDPYDVLKKLRTYFIDLHSPEPLRLLKGVTTENYNYYPFIMCLKDGEGYKKYTNYSWRSKISVGILATGILGIILRRRL